MLNETKVGQFVLQDKVGQGSYGLIYKVVDSAGDLFCAKLEYAASRHKSVMRESSVMERLPDSHLFPKYIASGQDHQLRYLVMEYLGPSLQSVLAASRRQLSQSTAWKVSKRILSAIRLLHGAGYIHRDIKPSNIVLRRERQPGVCLIDFGLAKSYRVSKGGRHVAERESPGFRGTALYASVNAHEEADLSRRDDLISWFYMFSELFYGKLPWEDLEERQHIIDLKRRYNADPPICKEYPEVDAIWKHIQELGFDDEPDYKMISNHMTELAKRIDISENDLFDWEKGTLKDHMKNVFDFEVDHSPGKVAYGSIPLQDTGLMISHVRSNSSSSEDQSCNNLCCCVY